MKTKKIVIGAMAATMLSLSVCSLIPAAAAGETVQISVSNASAKAGENFTVEVSLADIPSTGIQACNFSLEYDSSLITISKVTAGSLTKNGADSSDPSASLLPAFNSFTDNNEGSVSFMWSTSLDDASYWLKGEGVFCTITGKVAAGVADGTVADIKIVPTKRDTATGSGVVNDEIDCGYLKSGERVSYAVKTNSGSVTVGSAPSTTKPPATTNPPATGGKKGDANCDGSVTVADAAAILQYLGNNKKFSLSEEGIANADCDGAAGLTTKDALHIQEFAAGIIPSL